MTKPKTEAEKVTQTTLDTICFTVDEAKAWAVPGLQRGVKINDKVKKLAEELVTNGGVLPGIVTLGVLGGKTYLVDGQQRRQSFFLSKLPEGYADVRMCYFDTMAELGVEFVKLNSNLVNMTADDKIKGLEASSPNVARLRRNCPFIGYSGIRRNDTSAPVLSMSAIIRFWAASKRDVPAQGVGNSLELANFLTEEDVAQLTAILTLCYSAWGRDFAYQRLWGGCNMIPILWLYQRIVNNIYYSKSTRFTSELFGKCLMQLSADATYTDWLGGRNFSARHRAPIYNKIKAMFVLRYKLETGKDIKLPAPPWTRGYVE